MAHLPRKFIDDKNNLQFNGIDRIVVGNDSVNIRLDGYNILSVHDGYTFLNDQFGNTCMQFIPNAIGFSPGVELWNIGPQVTLFGLVQFPREDIGPHNGANLVIQAQDGQQQDGYNNNTNGGNIRLTLGQRGFGGGGTDGLSGNLILTDFATTTPGLIRMPHAGNWGVPGGRVLVAKKDGGGDTPQTYLRINAEDLHVGDDQEGGNLYFDVPVSKEFHFQNNSQDVFFITPSNIMLKLANGPVTVFDISSSQINVGIGTIQFQDTLPTLSIFQPQLGGTGANSGSPFIIQAQAGQNQTGVTTNNDGGGLFIKAGDAGTGGGGADGLGGNVNIGSGNGTNTTTDGFITLTIGVTSRVTITKSATLFTSDNVSYFGGAGSGGGIGIFSISDVSTPPTSNPSLGGFLYSQAGAGKWRGSSGTITTFGPAEPHCEVCGSDFTQEFENEKYGYLAFCLKCLADELGDRKWIRRQKVV